MSPTASVQSAHHAPTDKPVQQVEKANHDGDPADKNYNPRSIKFWSIMLGLYMTIFLVALDRTIIAVAIPAITNEFNSIEDIGWYGSAYMLTAACFNPVSGRIYQMYSTKWVYLTALTIFEIGSAICGAAPNSIAFIFGRTISGVGAAALAAGGMMVMMPIVPLRKRPTFTAFFGMAFGVASVVGPVVGGAFAENVSWRWCFYINLPLGAFTMVAIFLFFNIEEPDKREKLTLFAQFKRLDPLGLLFFLPAMVCLILALQWGGSTYSWSNPKIIGLLVTFAVCLVAFIVVEAYTPETATMPGRVVLQRSVGGSLVYSFLISGAVMSIIYYISIWFQAVKGDSTTKAGVSTIPLMLAMVTFGIISAKVTERIGYYIPSMLLGPVFCSVAAGMLSTMTRSSNHSAWIGYQALFGFGLGCGFQQANLALQTVLPRKDIPIGMALYFFMQQIGGAVFVSVGQNIFTTKIVDRLSGVAGLDTQMIVNTGATDIRKLVPADLLDTVLDAYNFACTRVFLMGAILSAMLVLAAGIMEWRSIKGKKGAEVTPQTAEKKAEEGVA